MQKPLVSIITPTYNHEQFIAECIESVLAQSYSNWEMLIVDDGSTDHTWQVIQQYAVKDSRIRAFHQENKGIWRLAETYNYALEKSLGEFIAILEGDDFWPKDKLAKQINYHLSNPNLILSHGKVFIVKKGLIIGEYPKPPLAGLLPSLDYFQLAILSRSCIMPVSVMIKKTYLEQIDGFIQAPTFPAVDYSTWLRLFKLQGEVSWLDSNLGFWRQSTAQVTQNLDADIAEAVLKIALAEIKSLPPELDFLAKIEPKRVIRTHYIQNILPSYVVIARKALIKKDKHKATFYAFKLIRRGTLKRKLQGFYILLASNLGWNMEHILRSYEFLSRFSFMNYVFGNNKGN